MDIALLQMLTKAQLKSLLHGIHNAFDEHLRLAFRCHSLLISCRTTDSALLDSESHLKCNFGRWYHGNLPNELRNSPEFSQLGDMHRRFHEKIRQAALCHEKGDPIPPDLCEELLTSQSDLLLALNQYLMEVIEGDQLFDPLTGLLNRLEMGTLLAREQARSERSGAPSTLAIADLDFFKNVNDRYGHEAGDGVLKETSACLASALRPYDLLFRIGGEEFLFCFPDTDLAEAHRICERIRQKVESLKVRVAPDLVVSITTSIGLAPLETGKAVSHSLRRADLALYAAKAGGRNLVKDHLPS